MRLGFASALVVALLASGPCAAQAAPDLPRPLRAADGAAPTFTVFSSRDGLGDEVWSTVGFGPDGFVWAGSASSLARFDGYRWSQLAKPPGRSLVRDLANSPDGRLWAIFESEGLAQFDGQAWQRAGTARFHQRFSTVGGNGSSELWVAHNRGLARWVDGRWVEDAGNGHGGPGRMIAFARTRSLFGGPREWLASADKGLWFRELAPETGPWQRFMQPVVHDMSMTDLVAVPRGDGEELWAVSYGGGIARLREDGTRIWRAANGELPTEAIYSAVHTRGENGERTVWMASRAGLLRFRGDRVDAFDRRHGLPSDAVRGIKVQRSVDGIDSLWLATEGGLARATLSPSPWQTVSLLGARENGVFGVLVEPNGRGGERLWLGSSKEGLAMLEDGQWRRFDHFTGELPAAGVRGLWRLPGPDGRPRRVLSLVDAPLHEITDALAFVPLETPWPTNSGNVANHMIARTVDGVHEWWAATSGSGIYRLREGRWQQFPDIAGDTAPVHWLAEQVDARGRSWLWAADLQGLARFDGEHWQRLPATLGLPEDGLRSLLVRRDGDRQVLWASSTHNGILRLDVSDPLQPRRLDDAGLPPPPDPTIYSVLPDRQGRLYVCTNNGVQQLTPLPAGGYSERVFRRRDGLVHDECNTNAQFVDGHDRYWVGTLGGLALFDPDAQPTVLARRPKPLHFTELRVDGELPPVPPDLHLSLPSNVQELRIEYSLLTGLREGETRYRTQLVGLDPGPGAWTPERSRSFSALAPGEYRFRVEARDFAGTEAAPRELRLTVTPLWWQQPWLQAVAVLLSLGLAAAAVLFYNRGLRQRQKQLRQQVAERTQDLHSANLRLTELSYLDPLTGIANRRRLIEAIGLGIARAIELGKPIGLIVADVDHFKQYNDRHGHLAGDAALRAIATAMGSALREQDLVARFGGEEFACLMLDANPDTVHRVAERMRALVEALPPRSLGNESQGLTISAGVLSCVPEPGQTPEALLHRADLALYEAKAAGRNRVQAADPPG